MRLSLSRRALLLASAVITPACLLPHVARAQDGATPIYQLDDIIVRGDTVDRSLKDTASSVTVIGDEDLEDKAALGTVNEIIAETPNVFVPSTTSAPIIRGIDSDGPLVAGDAYLSKPLPRATISVDGRYVDSTELSAGGTTTWDVESIEVFRGPQTTSQGANAIAGAIVVNTKDPTFTPEFAAQAIYGSRNKKRLSFAASGPLSSDLAARFSLDYTGRDTFVAYTNPAFTQPNFDYDFQSLNGRIKLLWQPTDLPQLRLKLTYSHTDLHRPRNEAVTDIDALTNTNGSQDFMDVVSDGVLLDAEYDFLNGINLSNRLQYSQSDYDYIFAAPFTGVAARDYNTVSNELKLTFGEVGDTWSGVVGLFYSDEDADASFSNSFNGAPFGSADLTYKTRSAALYGETTYRFLPDWSLTGGLRLQRDSIKIAGVTSFVAEPLDYDETFTEVLPSLTLAHDINPNWTVGGTLSRGYLPGGTGTNFRGGEYYEFDPETADNAEIFVRGSALDGALVVSGNLFYTEYSDIQRSIANCLDADCTVTNGSVIVNGESATAYGLELSADYQITSSLRLSGNLGALNTEVKEFTDPGGQGFEGTEFARSPSYTAGLAVAWDITPALMLQGDVRYVDGYFSNDTNDSNLAVDGFTLANMRLSYQQREGVEYFAYVNNVFDERGPLSASVTGTVEVAEPREVGIGVRVNF